MSPCRPLNVGSLQAPASVIPACKMHSQAMPNAMPKSANKCRTPCPATEATRRLLPRRQGRRVGVSRCTRVLSTLCRVCAEEPFSALPEAYAVPAAREALIVGWVRCGRCGLQATRPGWRAGPSSLRTRRRSRSALLDAMMRLALMALPCVVLLSTGCLLRYCCVCCCHLWCCHVWLWRQPWLQSWQDWRVWLGAWCMECCLLLCAVARLIGGVGRGAGDSERQEGLRAARGLQP